MFKDTFDKDVLNETKWATPDSYFGYNPTGEYCVYAITRDESIMGHVNFDMMKESLVREARFNKCEGSVYTWTAAHWGCGHVEYLMVKQNAHKKVLTLASEFLQALAEYPCLDDEKYSERQYDDIYAYWKNETIEARIQWIHESTKTIDPNIFAARHDDTIPEDVFEELYQSEMFR